jgi:hypothetical protein
MCVCQNDPNAFVPRPRVEDVLPLIARIVECTDIPAEGRDDFALFRTRLFAARGYAKAALRHFTDDGDAKLSSSADPSATD